MSRCRRTDAIAEIVADPALGIDALTDEHWQHIGICADCNVAVRNLERLDHALTASLRSQPREELPPSVLATPALPRREPGPAVGPMLALAAVVVLAVGVAIVGVDWFPFRGIGVTPSTSPDASAPLPTASATVPAATPTPAPSASNEPTPTSAPTPDAEPIGLRVGQVAAVVDEPLVVRTAPGTDPDSTITPDRLWIGQRVRILDGPADVDGYTWWEVQVGEIRGWVADAELDDSAPWLAPLGNGLIAFADPIGSATMRIWTASADGAETTVIADLDAAAGMKLVLSCGQGAEPAGWSQDGTWLAFDYTANGCERAVGMVRGDGTGLRIIGPGHWPAWRPDGAALTYGENVPYQACGRDCPNVDEGPWGLVQVEIDGEPSSLTQGDRWTSATMPAWAPDRRTIAFHHWTADATSPELGGSSMIYLADADGDNARPLTDGQMPTWSPDGRWIVFTRSSAEGGNATLHRIRPDGTGLEAIGEVWSPFIAFAPDGSRIAVARETGLFTMAPDGSDAELAIPGTYVAGFDWSPDGRHIVAAIDYAGTPGLYRVSLAGEAPAILGMGLDGSSPAWQPLLLNAGVAD